MNVKRGDTHGIRWKANLDLTGASVRLIARTRGGAPIDLEAAIVDAAEGIVSHTLTGTLDVGRYRIELEATIGGEIITFPNDGYATLTVLADL